MIVSFLRRLKLAACRLLLEAYIFYNLNQGRRRNSWASILNQKTSRSSSRTPGLGPGGRV